jgi:ADP-heptose:LPS heptosyltransferase
MNRVLVIVYGHVADTMAAIPALRSLRRARPDARIEVLCLRSVVPVLSACPYVDALIPWTDFKRKQGRAAKLEKAARIARLGVRLRTRRYDTTLVFHRSFGALRHLASLTGAPNVVAADAAHGLESSREENRRVIQAVGIEEDGGPVELWTAGEDQAWADRLLAEAPGTGPIIGLHGGSDWSCQQWLPERFAHVGEALRRATGGRLVITGSPDEIVLQDEIAEGLSADPVRCAGKTSFGRLVALIRRLDLLICVNSAPAAIARAVGTPMVVLLGPEDPRLTGVEEAPLVRIVQPGRELAPGSWCEFGRWGVLSGCQSPMCRGLGGLGLLDPDVVVKEALELLNATRQTKEKRPSTLIGG